MERPEDPTPARQFSIARANISGLALAPESDFSIRVCGSLCRAVRIAGVLQPVSWERMSNAVEAVRRRLLCTAKALREAGVPYAIVGGNAVAAWVSRVDESAVRNTRDVDVLIRRADLPAAIAAMAAAGFRHREVASLGRKGHLDVFLDALSDKIRDAVHVVFAAERVDPESPVASADVEESESTADFRLIALEALVRMKLAAYRDRDRVHLRDLLSVGLVDVTWVARFDPPLRERLQQIIDQPDG
jgi:hypothetical protein